MQVDQGYACMHADLVLLYLLYLWIMLSTNNKSWTKLLSISLPSSLRGHPGLAKYHTVWTTLMPSHCPVQFGEWEPMSASWRLFGKSPLNSLIVERTGFIKAGRTAQAVWPGHISCTCKQLKHWQWAITFSYINRKTMTVNHSQFHSYKILFVNFVSLITWPYSKPQSNLQCESRESPCYQSKLLLLLLLIRQFRLSHTNQSALTFLRENSEKNQ